MPLNTSPADRTGSSRTTLVNKDRSGVAGTYTYTASSRGIYVCSMAERGASMTASINGVVKPTLSVDHYTYHLHSALLVNKGDTVKFAVSSWGGGGDIIISFYSVE